MTDEMASRLCAARARFESAKAEASQARAKCAAGKVLVDAAHEAWATAFREASPDAPPPTDPEVEWNEPASEEEAEADLMVARLGGELTAARLALESAHRKARDATACAMRAGAALGRIEWESRN